MEKYKLYLKKFKIALAILLAGIAIFVFIIAKTVPQIKKITSTSKKYKVQASKLVDSERRLSNLKNAKAQEIAQDSQVLKAFFKPITSGLDTEAAVSDEFGEILQIMRENKIKTRSLKYDYDPEDDNFVKFAANKFHVCRVTAEMVASYANFENFLRDLYKHEHFLEISKIEIVPYQKDRKILLINLQIKLYAQRDGSSPAPVVKTPTEENPAVEPAQKQSEPAQSETQEDEF